MSSKKQYEKFLPDQLMEVNQAVDVSEELIANYYKLSVSQMRQLNYDIKTLGELEPHEIVDAHFAQIVRYRAQKKNSSLETEADDFYKICLQDHNIIEALKISHGLTLYPFMVYITCHELIHVVRFRRFIQHFHAPADQRQAEEIRVHQLTRHLLGQSGVSDLDPVFGFYSKWQDAVSNLDEPYIKPVDIGMK